jgi:hypothetical protein
VAADDQPLRLIAEDAEDLKVLSAALQDAVGKIGDIAFDATGRSLTLALNRFCWESGAKRVRCGLQFGGVMSVKARKLRQDAPKAVVELLAVEFEAGEPPGGAILLKFAGGGDLLCEVECIDAALADVSSPWPTRRAPAHER